MDDAILLLRLLLGVLMAGHALQKLLGWFGGFGIDATARLFESWGLRPSRLMVGVAGTAELLGAVLIATGTLTALGVAAVVGTMLVAASVSFPHGFWASKGGYELAAVYGLLGLGIGLAGPGRYSVDAQAGLLPYDSSALVLLAAAAGVVGAAPLVVRVVRTEARKRSADAQTGTEQRATVTEPTA
ncbi:MAG TPA: DoxX family protein [Pseudonocardia sp.]